MKLSILSQLQRTGSRSRSRSSSPSFQFFPSCSSVIKYTRLPFTFFLLSILSQLQLAPGAVPIDIPCPPSFNSFPVAAGARPRRLPGAAEVFQFFPSCSSARSRQIACRRRLSILSQLQRTAMPASANSLFQSQLSILSQLQRSFSKLIGQIGR